MKRPVIEVTATVTFTYDLLDVYRVVSNEATAIEDVISVIDSDELTAEQFTITARTFDAEPCPRCEGSGEVTRPGTATRDSNGVWDRETTPCPKCQ